MIELLVVISIIALLVALLLPALSKARETAMSLQCLNQTRQITLGAMNYAQDNGGELPTHHTDYSLGYGVASTGWSSSWTQAQVWYKAGFILLATDYVTSYDTWFCPSQTNTTFTRRDWNWAGVAPAGTNLAYGGYIWRHVNDVGVAPSAASNGGSIRLARPDSGQFREAAYNASWELPFGYNYNQAGVLRAPSDIAYAADGVFGFRNPNPSGSNVTKGMIDEGHRLGGNAGYYDGHGEFRSHLEYGSLKAHGTGTNEAVNAFAAFLFMYDHVTN